MECERGYTRRIQGQRTRTRQTERLVLVREQNKSFFGPGEIDKTSSGATFGSVGAVDSCLAANTGKYIFPDTTRAAKVTEPTPIKNGPVMSCSHRV